MDKTLPPNPNLTHFLFKNTHTRSTKYEAASNFDLFFFNFNSRIQLFHLRYKVGRNSNNPDENGAKKQSFREPAYSRVQVRRCKRARALYNTDKRGKEDYSLLIWGVLSHLCCYGHNLPSLTITFPSISRVALLSVAGMPNEAVFFPPKYSLSPMPI